MIKISFWLKKPSADQGSLEHIIISNPQKILEGKFVGMYVCEVSLPESKEIFPLYASNPVDALHFASNTVKIYLQNRVVKHGYKISETENGESWREAWKLEVGEPDLILKERVKRIKESKDIPPESKQEVLKIMKENFGKSPHMKDS